MKSKVSRTAALLTSAALVGCGPEAPGLSEPSPTLPHFHAAGSGKCALKGLVITNGNLEVTVTTMEPLSLAQGITIMNGDYTLKSMRADATSGRESKGVLPKKDYQAVAADGDHVWDVGVWTPPINQPQKQPTEYLICNTSILATVVGGVLVGAQVIPRPK